ncbi:MAG: hypothetical protein V3S64_08100 [bacterium]
MKRFFWTLAIVAALTLSAAEGLAQRSVGVRARQTDAAEKRVALVIGNAKYGRSMGRLGNALITAEEKGITQANVVRMARSARDPEVRSMLGRTGSFGPNIGLSREWAVWSIRAVGNYGEIFQRNLGRGTRLFIDRGLNQLWSKGGILFSPPIR